jgi:hypothetical protein
VIRRSPVEYFLKYLIVDNQSNAEIQETLFEMGLDDLGEYYIDRLRKKLNPPKVFHPKDKLHFKSQRFLMKEGIQDLFFPDNDTATAYRILDMPRLKEFVESMLIVYAPIEAIAHSLTRHRGFRSTARAVELYKMFFWNVDLLDSVQMRALLKMRPGAAAAHPSTDVQRQAQALQQASWNDPRRSAAEMPFSPLSSTMAQMRMGMMPAEVNLPRILERSREMAAMTSYEAMCTNGSKDHMKARDLAEIVKSYTDVLETIVKPDENMREQLSAIAMKTEEKQVPFLGELSKGRHTVDMQPQPQSKAQEIDDDGELEPVSPGDAAIAERGDPTS